MMTVPCPCCRANNDTPPQCRRCRTDLALLFRIQAQRDDLIQRAKLLLREDKFDSAQRLLVEAANLRKGRDIQELLAITCLLKGDFASAFKLHQVLAGTKPPTSGSP